MQGFCAFGDFTRNFWGLELICMRKDYIMILVNLKQRAHILLTWGGKVSSEKGCWNKDVIWLCEGMESSLHHSWSYSLSLFLTVLLLLLLLTQYQDILVTKGTITELKLGAKPRWGNDEKPLTVLKMFNSLILHLKLKEKQSNTYLTSVKSF